MDSRQVQAALLALPLNRPSVLASVPVRRYPQGWTVGHTQAIVGLKLAVDSFLRLAPSMTFPPRKPKATKPGQVIVPEAPIYPPELRALSLYGYWPWLAVKGYRLEECRSWTTNRRGLTLIHVSSSKEDAESFHAYGVNPDDYPRSCIIGATNLVDCVGTKGDYLHIWADPVIFDEPILNVPGSFNYWKPAGPNEQRQIQAFNEAWRKLGNG